MARKSDGEKIDQLMQSTTASDMRLDALAESLVALASTVSELVRSVSDLRRDLEKELALLTRDVEDLKKWRDEQKKDRDEWNRRLWAFGPNALGAVLSGVIAAIVAFFVAHR